MRDRRRAAGAPARQRRQGRRQPAGDRSPPASITVKKLASQTNEQDVQLRALEREAKTERDLLESYLAEISRGDSRATTSMPRRRRRASFRAPRPAIKPDYPKKLPTVLIAAFAAFALSAGFTVTGALLAPSPSSYGYAYAPASYAAPAYAAPAMAAPVMPRVASPPLDAIRAVWPPPWRPCLWRSARWSRSRRACGKRARPAAASPWSAPCAMSAPPMPRLRSPARWRATPMSCWSIWPSARPICR